jgi:predicted permease
VLTLAVCIGVNLAIFAVIDGVLMRDLPFPKPDQLVTMFNTYPKAGVERDGSSVANYYERRGNIPALSSLSIFRRGTGVVGEPGATERQDILKVSAEFFSTLGVNPALGRSFTDEEMAYNTDDVAVLADSYWKQKYHADPHVIGRTVRVDGLAKKIVGVLPPRFRFLSFQSRVFLPFSSSPEDRAVKNRHSGSGSDIVARLVPGASIREAQAQIDAQNAALADSYPQAKMIAEAGFRTPVVSLHADHVRTVRSVLLLLQAGALLLLILGGANLVNLLLIQASSRTKEMAIRQSLGAGRLRVIRQVIVETLLLALVGGLAGIILGGSLIRVVGLVAANQLPLGAEISMNGRVAAAALLGAVLVGTAAGVPLAWLNLRSHLSEALQSQGRGGTLSFSAQRLRHSFIVAQIALAFVLLTGAGLLGLSLKRAMEVSPGFRPDHVLAGAISLPWNKYRDDSVRMGFVSRLREEAAHLPGVLNVGIINNLPLSGNRQKSAITVKGYVPRPGESVRGHYSYGIFGDYFAAMGIPLLEGRLGDQDDFQRERRICVVDRDFAGHYWPQGGAIGQSLFEGSQESGDQEAFTVVGVVGSVKQAGLTDNEQQGAVYFPFRYRTDGELFLVARTGGRLEPLGAALQKVVRQLDPDLPLNNVGSMEVRVADSLVARRSPALLSGLFAAVALLLAAIGTYGVLSFAVAQRYREIGVRLALGALPKQIEIHFLKLGLRLLGLGTLFGLIGSALAGRAMQSMLFGVPGFNVASVLSASGVLTLVALAACLLPALRASRVDPINALRHE